MLRSKFCCLNSYIIKKTKIRSRLIYLLMMQKFFKENNVKNFKDIVVQGFLMLLTVKNCFLEMVIGVIHKASMDMEGEGFA